MIGIERLAGFILNQHMSLILMPAEQCNFRCIYCYEDFTIGKMSKTTIEAIKQLIR